MSKICIGPQYVYGDCVPKTTPMPSGCPDEYGDPNILTDCTYQNSPGNFVEGKRSRCESDCYKQAPPTTPTPQKPIAEPFTLGQEISSHCWRNIFYLVLFILFLYGFYLFIKSKNL